MSQPALTRVVQQLRLTVGVSDTVSDAQLLERFLDQRDEVAFELLVRRHERLVLGVCRRVLRNPHDVDDAFQATFLLLIRKAGSIGNRSALAAWLHQVAFRVALRANDDCKRRKGREADVDPETLPSREPDPAEAKLDDLGSILDRELSRLPEKYRTAVALCYLEGCTYEEAAQRLDCPRGTVSIWLTRAREMLRGRLARRGVVLSAVGLVAALGQQATAAPVALTVQAAFQWASRGMTAAGLSARAVTLAEGVLRTMFLTKLKVAAAMLLAVVVVTGGGVAAVQSWAADTGDVGKTGQQPPPAGNPGDLPDAGKVGVPPPGDSGSPTDQDGGDAKSDLVWQEKLRLEVHKDKVMTVVFSPDAKQLAAGGLDGKVVIWDVMTGKELKRLNTNPPGDPVHSLAFSPDGKLLAVAGGVRGEKGKVTLWETAGPSPLVDVGKPADVVTSVAFSPDGRSLVFGGRDQKVQVYDLGPPPQNLIWSTTLPGGAFSVAFSPDGQRVVAAGGEEMVRQNNPPGEVHVFDARTGKTYQSNKNHPDTVSAATFSPDGKLLATGSFDKTVRVWDAASGKEVRQFQGHGNVVRTLAFSPDGKLLASGGFDSTVRLWDAATGKQVATIKQDKAVMTVVFSPDGKWLVTGSGGEVRIYEAVPRKAAAALPDAGGGGSGGDRIDALLQDLLKRQRSDDQILEALFLATLARLPSDIEKKFGLDTINKSKNRGEAFRDVLFALIHTKEFRDHAETLAERARRPAK